MVNIDRSSVVESLLPDDFGEHILERLPVKSLLRFKSVSKKWKSTIESRRFQENQLIRRRQDRGPDVLLVSVTFLGDDSNTDAQRISVGSSIISTIRLPVSCSLVCHGSCDGLLCLYCFLGTPNTPNFVVNPATRWQQTFPLSNIQQLLLENYDPDDDDPVPKLGFGKDKYRGTYKPVMLYNSSEFGLNNVTTCEIFDFSTKAWRYVVPASSYRINDWQSPVYLDGSLYWITSCEEEPKVLSFDLHTETFQVTCKVPFSLEASDPHLEIMSILDNRLCLSEKKELTKEKKELTEEKNEIILIQVIWSLDSSGENKTWEKLYSLNLTETLSWFKKDNLPPAPIAILDKNKLLLQAKFCLEKYQIYDLHAKSYDLISLKPKTRGDPVYYYQSLFSAY